MMTAIARKGTHTVTLRGDEAEVRVWMRWYAWQGYYCIGARD